MKNWRRILWPIVLRNMLLHRFGKIDNHWSHLLPRHANVHVVITVLHTRFGHIRFGHRYHRLRGHLVPTISRDGRSRGHLGYLSLCLLNGAACGLLLLLLLLLPGGLAVDLAMDAFPHLTLLAFVEVPLLVHFRATH